MLTGPTHPAAPGRRLRHGSRRVSRVADRRRAGRSAVAERDALRLVGGMPADGFAGPEQRPIDGTTDPRWVFAVRVAEKLEGSLLRPEYRQQLVRLGSMLGLSAFDCNLAIAIVQDQARRGHAPAQCPTAGEAQLRMIPLPRRASFLAEIRRRPALLVAAILATLIVVELLLLNWLL